MPVAVSYHITFKVITEKAEKDRWNIVWIEKVRNNQEFGPFAGNQYHLSDDPTKLCMHVAPKYLVVLL